MKPLQEYKKKRDFKVTSEPGPKLKTSKAKDLMFVVQEHHASHLHYDFRLEYAGVLKSWSVPKGPSPDPSDKRLAVEVEDHPYDYGNFEGIIPDDEYGGGEVFIWDTGTWIPESDAGAALKKGRLDFTLKGKRMKGRWSLIRLRPGRGKPNWLLFKCDDEYANDDSKYQRIKAYGSKKEKDLNKSERSVTKKMLEHELKSKKTSTKSTGKKAVSTKVKKKPLQKAPDFIAPELALLVDEPPQSGEWVHEMKFDGYRIQARVVSGEVSLKTRSGQDWTEKYSTTARALSALKLKSAIFDGEIVALDAKGRSDFQALQSAMKDQASSKLVYCIFDLLHLNGQDLRLEPLESRKRLLEAVLKTKSNRALRYSKHIEENAQAFLQASCEQELEGIISKKKASTYHSGRTQDWVKSKCLKRQEFVIGGFTEAQGARENFGALLLGVYEGDQLRFVGKCGTGFNGDTLKEVYRRLKPLEIKTTPYALKSPKERGIHWVKPRLVCEAKFAMWTRDEVLRVPVFQGMREDKDPHDIRKEVPKKIGEEEVLDSKKVKKPREVEAVKTSSSSRKSKLSAKSKKETSSVNVEVTHPDKILFEGDGVTKGEVAQFYANPLVSRYLLPQISNRPLALNRCPNGAKAQCFYQKHLAHVPGKTKDGKPSPLHEIKIKESSGVKGYITIDSVEGLVALVQMGAYELHAWGCTQPDVEHPDQIVMDFDPSPEVPFSKVKEAAFELKRTLDKLNLVSFLKVTGGKGLHVHIPLERKYSWDQIKSFSKILADEMTERFPERFTAVLSKKARIGKIFIDYLRNGRSATAVAPYIIRAKTKSAVAMPIAWTELKELKDPSQFTLKKSLEYLAKRKVDPWANFAESAQSVAILDHHQKGKAKK